MIIERLEVTNMRVPKVNSKFDISKIKKEVHKIDIYCKASIYNDYYNIDEKNYVKFIKKVEKIVRNSYEYRDYIKFLKEELNMNQCSFLKNINKDNIKRVSIEMHHSPLSLFDVSAIVFNSMKLKTNKLTHIDVAEEITKKHYENKIGLIPLSSTVHELVHSGDIFVPIDYIYGDFKAFLEEYEDGVTEEHIILLKKHIKLSQELEHETYNPTVLERKFIYLDVDGMEFPKLMDDPNKKEKSKKAL